MPPFSFFKYHNAGNDFILIEDEKGLFPQKEIPALCARRFGIGADGLLLVQPSSVADYKMRIFNADGSEASMCGNGLGCVSAHLGRDVSIETRAGIPFGKDASIETHAGISFSRREAGPLFVSLPRAELIKKEVTLEKDLTGTLVDTGTPHLVLFTSNLHDPHLTALSKQYRTRENVNVTLVKVYREDFLEVRTFEKGVTEETLACGTGGAAAALLFKKTPITVLYPSQKTALFSLENQGKIWMEVAPRLTFTGTIP